jgi:hypothetical protein
VPGSNSDAETLFSTCYGGVVDGLDVDIVFGEELVGGGFGECGIAYENRNDVGRTGAERKRISN